MNSSNITSELTTLIKQQSLQYDIRYKEGTKSKEESFKNVIKRIKAEMNDKEKRLVDLSTQTGVSKWLTLLPITEFEFEPPKQLRDSIKLRYGWEITNLPTTCPCGSKFNIQNSMSFKKAGFISVWYRDLRDRTANMMSEVYKDTKIEPKLAPLSGEELYGRTSNNLNEARIDIADCANEGNRHFST